MRTRAPRRLESGSAFRPDDTADGFTLLEVCIAAGLLAVTLVALAGLFTITAESDVASRYRTLAAALAQDKIERLRADIAVGQDVPAAGIEFVSEAGELQPPAEGAFNRTWTVSPTAGGPPGLLLLEVDVQPRVSGQFRAGTAYAATAVPRP